MTPEQINAAEPLRVNGKSYPLWSKFVRDERWIGGVLEDLDPDSGGAKATIKRILLAPNGTDSAYFEVETDAGWSCACDVRHLGIVGAECKDGWCMFMGYGGHRWRIRQREQSAQAEPQAFAT